MMELSRRAPFMVLPMLLLAGLFLGACGSSGGGKNSSTPSGAPQPLAPRPHPPTDRG